MLAILHRVVTHVSVPRNFLFEGEEVRDVAEIFIKLPFKVGDMVNIDAALQTMLACASNVIEAGDEGPDDAISALAVSVKVYDETLEAQLPPEENLLIELNDLLAKTAEMTGDELGNFARPSGGSSSPANGSAKTALAGVEQQSVPTREAQPAP